MGIPGRALAAMVSTTLAIAVLLGCAPQAGATVADVSRVAVLGDSLTRGYGVKPAESWASIMEARAAGDNVLPIGYDGATVRTWNTVYRDQLTQLTAWRPSTVVIALGGNDYYRSVSTAQYRANLAQLIADVRAASPYGVRVILWHYYRIEAVPVRNLCDVDQCNPAYPSPTWQQYGDAMRATAIANYAGYVDNSTERNWLRDYPLPGENPRIHLSWQGHRVMEQSIYGRLLRCC